MESARYLLEDSKLGKEFWGHTVLTAAHIHNCLPSCSQQNRSPLEHWTGKGPDIGYFRALGSPTWVHIPREKRQKLDPKSVRCLLVGYEEHAETRIYRLYNLEGRKLILSGDIIIDESSATYNTSKVSETATIEWDNGVLPVPVLAKGTEVEHNDFLPQHTIVPQAGPVAAREGILDSITLRPRLATEPLLPEGWVKI